MSSKLPDNFFTYNEKSSSFDSDPILLEIELFNSELAFSKLAFFCFSFDLEISTEVSVSSTFKIKGFWSNIAKTSPLLICSL